MSIGWGFAAGVGQGLYSVADDRIKESLLQRRELRTREAQMELEQYKADMRRKETAEERSYLEKKSEVEYGRDVELQKLKGKQALERSKISAGKTGAGKGFSPIEVETDQGTKLYSFNKSSGKYTPYEGPGGGTGMSEEDLDARTDEWASAKFGAWASKDDMKAAAEEIGYKGPLSRNALKFAYKESLRGGSQPSVAQAAPTDIGSASVAQGEEAAQPKASETQAQKASELRKRFEKNPTQYPAYLEEQGFSPEEVETRAEKRGLIKRGGKWVVAEEVEEATVSERFRSPEGKKAVSNRERIAQSWAENMTEESAKEQFKTGPEMNRFLRKKKYLEYLTEKQRKAIFYIMRQLPKSE